MLHRVMVRRLTAALAFATVLGVHAIVAERRPVQPAPAQATAPTTDEILWDKWGVPHIFATSDAAAFRAFGWAQMESHANLVLRLYGQSRGRAAEYWGGDQMLALDKYTRLMGIPQRGKEWVSKQSPSFAPLLSAFVDGVNAYAKANPDTIAPNMAVVLPITEADVLAHLQRVVVFNFVSSPAVVQGTADRWERASNAWAIAPSRTASGNTLLLQNPHLPWSDFYTWFEAGITTGTTNAYGAALVGMPWLGIAFNDVLGWTHTVNTMDGGDIYQLQLAEGSYQWNGAVKAFETTTETIKIKNADGSFREEPLVIKKSIHGPVVREKGNTALAFRVVGLDQANIGDQYLQMIRAKSFDEFQAAERRLEMPFFTTMYADKAGHIMHLFGGRTPVRPAGPYSWSTIVPGTTDATLWTKTHPYEELPKVIDPATGWLQNANDPPWTTTFPVAIDPKAYPTYMAPQSMSFRAQRSAKLAESNPNITLEMFTTNKMSTRMELADRLLDELLTAAKAAGAAGGPSLTEAIAVLEKWDRCADADSRGAVLFEAWFRRLSRTGNIFAKPWSAAEPRTTPSGLANPTAAVTALAGAANDVKQLWGSIDVAWGVVHRLRIGTYDVPANGGPGDLGIFRVVGYEDERGATGPARKQIGISGDSYVGIVEFTPTGPRASTLITYGNATQPGSPHVGDQLTLFAEKKLKPVWRTRAEVERNLEKKETIKHP